MAIKCISKNCPFADADPDNCHFIDCCDFAVEQRTNADRIRAMSDEELAKRLDYELRCPASGDCAKMFKDCKACWLDWLQKPAEEDKHEP